MKAVSATKRWVVCALSMLAVGGCRTPPGNAGEGQDLRHNGIEAQLVIPCSAESGDRYVSERRDTGHLHVLLWNRSRAAVQVWEAWNSWGYYCLRLEFRDQTGRTYEVSKRWRGWTKNFPRATLIRPGEAFILNVEMGQRYWSGLPTRPEEPSGYVPYQMRAVYENTSSRSWDGDGGPPERSAIQSVEGVWTGRAVSGWVPVLFWEEPPDPEWAEID